MNRKELAGMLAYAADLMEVLGEGEFRARAYRAAARSLEQVEDDLTRLAAQGFRGVKGVGPGLAPMLKAIVESGEFPYLAELEARVPPGVLALFRVQGLGPKRIRTLWENGVDSLEELVQWAEAGQLRTLPGFGAKSEASLLEAARYALQSQRRVLLPVALEAAGLLLADLQQAGLRAELAGSARRGLETVGNLDLVAVASPGAVREALGQHAESLQGNVVQGRLEGLPLRVFCTEAASFGTALVQATGSQAWLEALGPLPPACPTEAAVFEALGRPFVPPYWREKEHIGLDPPASPLEPHQLQGVIHLHTTYSDGSASLRQMAEAALVQGYRYMVVCDHSRSAAYAGGLSVEAVLRQWAEIDRLNAELAPFRILKGIESEILPDGSLDYPEEMLARFEVVVGSLHSALSLEPAEQTERLLRALDNPYLSILGHPTGRLLLRRRGASADWERVLERAVRNRKIVEFNCNPARLDLDWRLLLAWRGHLNFSLGPDAHSVEGLADIRYGLLYANKAGLAPAQVVNTWPPEQLIAAKKGP
ncbi:DNA polymerase/3'-5' exonuclease PolX [Meiothermus sp. QL-1]|uniref:helix-hairpin-helix domain-containing protein n=1 Tax=Meiothermus sp. QL-1 TaxID=2058095 RepID=UPI000E0A1B40|nr:helix-hairpin-helix domain-containing protein [Meiothermus sp. QL-1]RDI96613.1 DNA polymerase/3'-5' exonuclease PolX [Meiothermus sp. QL-1]